MGCGLPKLKRSEDSSPGKIYSTLKRPQVETKVGVAYTYRFLDFILGKEGASGLCLSTLRELPTQLQDLYQQGFVLAAVHPFIHPCGLEHASVQHQLYRAVLIRHSDTSEKTQSNYEPSRLEIDLCLSADQSPNTSLIQGYVKKIQDAAEQGVMFVGFVQQPATVSTPGQAGAEEMSLSLHSSPSSLPGTETELNHSPLSPEGLELQDFAEETGTEDKPSATEGEEVHPGETETETVNPGSPNGTGAGDSQDGEPGLSDPSSSVDHPGQHTTATKNDSLMHNNNKAKNPEEKDTHTSLSSSKKGMEVFALFNHPGAHQGLLKYYTIKVPLRVQLQDEGVSGVEANWLDHMTQHFNSGASLVDGYFHLGSENDLMAKSVESVFIFQEGLEGDASYDAIVVEQWTIINGLEVKTDYIPLLKSLAMYGWKLTCVLSTPIVKTNSDGSLATKQIVFLQRPTLPRKKRDSKKLGFKARSKSNKNSVKDAPKYKKKKNGPSVPEKETEEQKICEDEERMCKEDSENVVKKNNENKENKRQSTETPSDGEKEAVLEAESKGREGVTVVEGKEERGTGTEGKMEERRDDVAKTVELREADIIEGKEGRALVEEEGEGTVEADTVEGREGGVEVETEKEVALETENQQGQGRSTDGQDRGATEQDGGGAEDQQEMATNGKGQTEDRVDCGDVVHIGNVTELTMASSHPELSSTDDPSASTD
ncbi:raftlin-like [Anguilla rostrata]|uniref:raftlin-like n=1 Tax=Anguilla rostrata TaxID=7938 RepID=UPI0030CC4A78